MSAPGITACPECKAGKCGNCDGTTWDIESDMPAPCPCTDRIHRPDLDCPTCSPHLHRSCPPGEAHRYCTDHRMVELERVVCPTHGIPDCSPLLNGCSYVVDYHRRKATSVDLITKTRLPAPGARTDT